MDRKSPDGWRWVRFGDVVREVRAATRDPEADGMTRVVGLEHLDSESLPLRRWNELADLPDGTSFTRVFRAGQVLFGKRRAYQRKVAVPDFDGVCSSDILVFEPSTDDLLPEFLPYLLQSDDFFNHALGTSAGSLSPRTKWQELARYEFALAPASAQQELIELLTAADSAVERLSDVELAARAVMASLTEALFDATVDAPRVALTDLVRRPIQYGVLKPGPEFPDGVRCIDVKDYPTGRLETDSVRRIDPGIDAQFNRSRLSAGDLVVSIRGTIGRVAQVPQELDGANISRDSARISLSTSVDPRYIHLILESRHAQNEMLGKVVGLAVKGINIADLRRVTIPLPPIDERSVFTSRSNQARRVAEQASESASRLRVARRALLGLAMTGGG